MSNRPSGDGRRAELLVRDTVTKPPEHSSDVAFTPAVKAIQARKGSRRGYASMEHQYITQGNLTENPKAILFLIDYRLGRRVKIWGEARVVEHDPELMRTLVLRNYDARPEQAILLSVSAWDANCPQHIPQRFEAGEVAALLAERDRRIAALEAEVARLSAGPARPPAPGK